MKLNIGLKVTLLSVVLVVLTVVTTTCMWYWHNRSVSVDRQSDLLVNQLDLEADHLHDAVQQLQRDCTILADRRAQSNLDANLRAPDVQNLNWTPEKFRNYMAGTFRTFLQAQELYSELRLIKIKGGADSWEVYIAASRLPPAVASAAQPSKDDAPVRDQGGIRTDVRIQNVVGEQDRSELRKAAAIVERSKDCYVTGVQVVGGQGRGSHPALMVECIAPVFETLGPQGKLQGGDGHLMGFITAKVNLTPLLIARQRAIGGTDRLLRVANEQGTVLAAWKIAGDRPPAFEQPGGEKLQDLYGNLQALFQRPGASEPLRINYWDNKRQDAGQGQLVSLEPPEQKPPEHALALAMTASYTDLAEKAPRPTNWLFLLAGALIAAAAALALGFSRVLTRPLKEIRLAAEDLAQGKFDVSLPVDDPSEVGVLARTFRHMVEQLRKRGRALRESEARARAVLDTAAEGVITIDEHGQVEAFNQAAERIFGYAAAEVKGHSVQTFLAPAHLQEIGGDVEQYLRTAIESTLGTTTEHVGRRKDGSTFPMEMSVSAVDLGRGSETLSPGTPRPAPTADEPGRRRLYTAIVRDITDRKRAEAEIRQLNEGLERRVQERTLALEKANAALEIARDQATDANRAKSAFLAQMSHELRTPLNAIIGYSELLQEDAEAAGQAGFIPDLRKIADAGKHLLTLINDVLDLSKIEAGKMELCVEAFEVAPLVATVVNTIRPLAEKNGNALEVCCPEQAGLMHSDPTRVRQVLFNLLSNACKFTNKGKVTLEVERASDGAIDWITFRVRDTGRGIKPEERKRIFQPFMQGDSSTQKQFGGTGLGLTISQRFCRMMGGDIMLETEWGKGSTFTVRLPAEIGRAKAEAGKRQGAPAAGTGSDPALHLPPTENQVLVVDDDMAVRDLLQRFLSKEGFQVLTASSGEEGLRLARQLRPAAITLDVLMPGMDGWSVLTALKANPDTSDIPVIMLTIKDEKNLGHALGAADYLTKPVDRNRLTSLLRRYQRHPASSILLVEDDAATREMLRRTLEKGGWTVLEAANGQGALECIRRETPALILLDLMMPEMDGFELVEELRHHEEWRAIPVVVLTAKDLTEEDRMRLSGSLLLSGHVKRVLRKGTYQREELLREVRELMAAHTDEAPGARAAAAVAGAAAQRSTNDGQNPAG